MTFDDGVMLPLFSIPVMKYNVKEYKNDIVDFDNITLENFYKNEIQKNTFNSINQNILLEEKFCELREIIDKGIEFYIYDQLKFSRDVIPYLTCSWMFLGYPGSITNKHIHSNSVFSGIFYLKSEKKSGDIVFSASHAQLTYTTPTIRPNPTEYNIFNSMAWGITPEKNDIIIKFEKENVIKS